MLGKDEILNLLTQNDYADFFEALDAYHLNTADYNKLKKEFISGKTDVEYNNRCKVLTNLFFKEKEAEENKDWQAVKANPTKALLLHFLETYPKSKHKLEAQQKLKVFEQQQTEANKWFNKGLTITDNNLKINFYTKAIELGYEPLYHAYHKRGLAKDNLQDYKGAIADYNQAIQLQPDYAIVYNNRGVAKDNLNDYKGAITDYTQAIQLQPDDAITYYNRGKAKSNLVDYQGAISDFNQAIQLQTNFAFAYGNRGLAKYYLQDYKGAIADYNQAIQLKNPELWKVYNNRGQTYFLLGKYAEAIADWEQMQAVAPLDYEPFYNYIEEARKKVRK